MSWSSFVYASNKPLSSSLLSRLLPVLVIPILPSSFLLHLRRRFYGVSIVPRRHVKSAVKSRAGARASADLHVANYTSDNRE